MYKLLKLISLVLQSFLLLSLISFCSGLCRAFLELPTNDPKLISAQLSAGVVISVIQIVPALFGLFLSMWLIKKNNSSKSFNLFCRYFAYLWLLFIPIGSILGFMQLKRLKRSQLS
ncbi:hypothetical protein [Pseudoalteromonas sp.]|uniref:hypothetical protein n=1 Tax=Pseudoalteromonas sp. TaxID=53249 RepID=UPI003001FEDA